MELESDYAYEGVTSTCRYDASKAQVKVTSWNRVVKDDPDQLKAAVALGPVSVSVDAAKKTFLYYSGGILNDSTCGTRLDHGVAAVGYGTENGQQYFIIRNSWGADWGESGYIRLAYATGAGICGLNKDNVWPATD